MGNPAPIRDSVRRDHAIKVAKNAERLANILSYPRRKGQTTAMLKGAIETNAIVLSHSLKHAQELVGKRGRSIDSLDSLQGLEDAVVVEHHTLSMILLDLSRTIRDLIYKPFTEK